MNNLLHCKKCFFFKSFIIINYIYLPIDIRQVQKQNLNLKKKKCSFQLYRTVYSCSMWNYTVPVKIDIMSAQWQIKLSIVILFFTVPLRQNVELRMWSTKCSKRKKIVIAKQKENQIFYNSNILLYSYFLLVHFKLSD